MTRSESRRPYQGLQPFSTDDSAYFFGRGEDQETIAANLVTARLTILYAASGVGKTSVLLAGVVPFLRGFPDILVVVFREWQEKTFLASLKDEVARAVTEMTDEAVLDVGLPFDDFLAQAAAATKGRLAIILDQFEEYFLYHRGVETGHTFEVEFSRAVNRKDVNAHFLIAIREDRLSYIDRFQGRIPNLFDNYLRIEHLDVESARKAIEEPIYKFNEEYRQDGEGYRLEGALVDAVLEQVQALGESEVSGIGSGADEPLTQPRIESPMLQLVMTRLWDEEIRLVSDVLRLKTLQDLGGAESIVGTHLNQTLDDLSPEEQEIAARIFRHLVTPGGTKIALSVEDLGEYAKYGEEMLRPVLVKLASEEARILRPVVENRYEIFHDVLAPAIRTWRTKYEQDVAQDLAAEEAAKREREAARQRELEGLRRRVAVLVVVLALVGLIAFWAWTQRNAANDARASAENSLQTATNALGAAQVAGATAVAAEATARKDAELRGTAEAVANEARKEAEKDRDIATSLRLEVLASINLQTDPQLSLLLGIEAVRRRHTSEADKALRQAFRDPSIVDHDTPAASLDPAGTFGVAFSPDGSLLASGNIEGLVYLWDVASGEETAVLAGHTAEVFSVAFSPDGDVLASGSIDGSVRLWDIRTAEEIAVLGTNRFEVFGVAFSPDGNLLASGSIDGTVVIWEVSTGLEIATLAGIQSEVFSVAFSPDGNLLASSRFDGSISLWDVATGQEISVLSGHAGEIFSVAFSPDGTLLASGSFDGSVRLWDVAANQEIPVQFGHGVEVFSVAFSPDSGVLASGAVDGTVRLWDITSGEEIAVLRGEEGEVIGLAFSPDGDWLASGNLVSGASVWDVGTVVASSRAMEGLTDRLEHKGVVLVESVAFRPGGEHLATGDSDGSLSLWDVASAVRVALLSGHEKRIFSVAFSPDGDLLASGGEDGQVRLWDVPTALETGGRAGLLATIDTQPEKVISVAFNPDGTLLVSGTSDGSVRIWSVMGVLETEGSGGALTPLSAGAAVLAVAFSPDGERLAHGTANGMVSVTDIEATSATDLSLQELLSVTVGSGVMSMAFSPDGGKLAYGSANGSLGMLDLGSALTDDAGSADSIELLWPGGMVFSVAFNPNGERLASGNSEGFVQIWELSTGKLFTTLSRLEEETVIIPEALGAPPIPEAPLLPPEPPPLTTITQQGPQIPGLISGDVPGLNALLERSRGVFSVAFSPDGELLASGSDDSAARLWPIGQNSLLERACNRAPRNLTYFEWESYFGPPIEEIYHRTCMNLPAHPSVKDALLERAEAEAREDQVLEALRILRLASSQFPSLRIAPEEDLAQILVQLGREYAQTSACAQSGQCDRAIVTLQDAVNYNPELALIPEAEVAVEVARVKAGQGDDTAALAEFQRAIDLDPTLSDTLDPEREVARALMDLARSTMATIGDYGVVERYLNRAVTLDSNIRFEAAYAWIELSREYAVQGAENDSTRALDQALTLDPNLTSEAAGVYMIIGSNRALREEFEQAMADLDQAAALSEELDGGVRVALAEAYIELCNLSNQDGAVGIAQTACGRAVQLAGETGNDFVNYKLCQSFRSTELAGIVEPACDRVAGSTAEIQIGATVNGAIDLGEQDLWSFQGELGQVITISMNADDGGLDTYLTLLGPDGKELVIDDDGGDNRNSLIANYPLPQTGTYTIIAQAFSDASRGAYRLSLLSP